jgi:hypothetical protein
MPQINTKRKQKKIFKKIKIISLLASFFVLFAIADLIYQNFVKEKKLFLDPRSEKFSSSQIEESLSKKNVVYKNIEEGSSYYVLELNKGEIVILSKNKSIDQQLSSLQLIQNRLKIEGKEFKSLDMRYAQPVIVESK